jgi:hypothetical protein
MTFWKFKTRFNWEPNFDIQRQEVQVLDRGLEFPRALKPVAEQLFKERHERR